MEDPIWAKKAFDANGEQICDAYTAVRIQKIWHTSWTQHGLLDENLQ
jgi:hypothetical protein